MGQLKPTEQVFKPGFPPEPFLSKNGKPVRKLYGDGDGLYLSVQSANAKSWVFRYSLDGKAHEMGLGKFPEISLQAAREISAEQRTIKERAKTGGNHPLAHRDIERETKRAEDAKRITFDAAAEQYIEAHKSEWKNERHAKQWPATLKTYASPVIGNLLVKDIDNDAVLKVLEPIWQDKIVTADRLRNRIEVILDWATVRKYRDGENPARWNGNLEYALASKAKLKKAKGKHLAGMPYAALPAFMATLRQRQGVNERALEFTILTAARTGETIGAAWSEFDLEARMWTVPANRIKAGREHRVPLCQRAMAILTAMKPAKDDPSGLVFKNQRGNKLAPDGMHDLLTRRMEHKDTTVHGFRSTFKTWATEQLIYQKDAVELALAHTVGNAVEQAYQRSDLLEHRRKLAEDWCRYCSPLALPAPSPNQVGIPTVSGAPYADLLREAWAEVILTGAKYVHPTNLVADLAEDFKANKQMGSRFFGGMCSAPGAERAAYISLAKVRIKSHPESSATYKALLARGISDEDAQLHLGQVIYAHGAALRGAAYVPGYVTLNQHLVDIAAGGALPPLQWHYDICELPAPSPTEATI